MPIVIRFLHASPQAGGEDVHIYDRSVKSTSRFFEPFRALLPINAKNGGTGFWRRGASF
jgi:hypothetical protein